MTTYTSVVPQGSASYTDATWREYLTAISTGLSTVGCVQSADTGQYNPSTVTWLGVPASGETLNQVWYLDDSLHATSPVYFKIWWYVSAGTVKFNVRVGSGSDGAGNLTGNTVSVTLSPGGGAGPAYSRLGVTGGDGYVGVLTDLDYATNYGRQYTFLLARTTDAAGDITSDGLFLYYYGGKRLRSVNGPWITPADVDYTFIPGSMAASHDAGQALNVYRHLFVANQQLLTCPFAVTVHALEVPTGVTIDAEPIVGQEHTYIGTTPYASATAQSDSRLAVIWE